MERKELFDQVFTPELVDKLYGYAYKRSFNQDEAQDLCQEIIAEILQALANKPQISNFDAYIWQIAHNTYCSHVRKQKQKQYAVQKLQDGPQGYDCGFEDDLLSGLLDAHQLEWIRREMAFAEIAQRLAVPENRVKQRLFSARNKIRKGVSAVEAKNNDVKLRPNYLLLSGTGDFSKSDSAWTLAARLLVQNILITCRETAKTAEEIARELEVPAVFMEPAICVPS